LILLLSDLEFSVKIIINMNMLIIDATNKKIFLMIIINNNIYSISHENSKINYEKLTIFIDDFLNSKSLKINNIKRIYVNRGPGNFAGVRNSLSVVKAFFVTKKIDYYCYSIQDFKDEKDIRYENIASLCDKFKIKKNLINPIYIG